MYVGHNSLRVYDYFLFAQEAFLDWVRAMREKIRETGSRQLITAGQDEGGVRDRLSPAFYGAAVDFTTNHSWWGTTPCCGIRLPPSSRARPCSFRRPGCSAKSI